MHSNLAKKRIRRGRLAPQINFVQFPGQISRWHKTSRCHEADNCQEWEISSSVTLQNQHWVLLRAVLVLGCKMLQKPLKMVNQLYSQDWHLGYQAWMDLHPKFQFYRHKIIKFQQGPRYLNHRPKHQIWVLQKIKVLEEVWIAEIHRINLRRFDHIAMFQRKKILLNSHFHHSNMKRYSREKMPLGKWQTHKCSSTNHQNVKTTQLSKSMTRHRWCNLQYQNPRSSHLLYS